MENKIIRDPKSKTEAVLKYMQIHGTITSMEAIQYCRATRLSAIIYILKDRGYNISTSYLESVNEYNHKCRFAEYKLLDR